MSTVTVFASPLAPCSALTAFRLALRVVVWVFQPADCKSCESLSFVFSV